MAAGHVGVGLALPRPIVCNRQIRGGEPTPHEYLLMKITSVIFDFGCVLSRVPEPADFEPIREALGVDAETFHDVYWRNRDAYDLDHMRTEVYWQGVGQLAGRELTAEEAMTLANIDCQIWSRPNPVMINWLGRLPAEGLKVALISNMSMHIGNYLRRTAAWISHCDPVCFSGELKLLKPDPAIYHTCLSKMSHSPAQALFIDDREVNVAAARNLGITGIVFKSVEQLQQDLHPYGLADSLSRVKAD